MLMYRRILVDEMPMVPVRTLRHAFQRQERQDLQVRIVERPALASDRQEGRDIAQVFLAERSL